MEKGRDRTRQDVKARKLRLQPLLVLAWDAETRKLKAESLH
jgi:hypothetical protein